MLQEYPNKPEQPVNIDSGSFFLQVSLLYWK